MSDTKIVVALITSTASLLVALVAGGIALWNRNKTDKNAFDIQELKGAVDSDLERLKAKLSHGQIVSSTQWNVEFNAYQAIWKGMVAIRVLATKIVLREAEMKELGIPGEYLALPERIERRKALIMKFGDSAKELLSAIHDNAPFYPAPIREAANETHQAAKELLQRHMTVWTAAAKGIDAFGDPTFVAECQAILHKIFEGVDQVESLMRSRLADVEVISSVV